MTPEDDQSDRSSVTTIASAIFGGIIGVLITVIVCVCVWCITRHIRTQISYNKERQAGKSVTNEQQQTQYQHQQQDGSTNVISMQQNEAYKPISLTLSSNSMEPTVYHTAAHWIPQQAIQLNLAYGQRDKQGVGTETNQITHVSEQAVRMNLAYGQRDDERCVARETEESGNDYERMYAAATGHVLFRQDARGLESYCSNIGKPREYELPVQQRGSYTHTQEDNEHQYDYIL